MSGKPKRVVGERCRTIVRRNPLTRELYVFFVLPDNGKFSQGDKVEVGVVKYVPAS